jgi:hypothetical protein
MTGVFTPNIGDEQLEALTSSEVGASVHYIAQHWKPSDGLHGITKAIVVGQYPALRQALKDAGIPIYDKSEPNQVFKFINEVQRVELPRNTGIFTGKRVALVGPAPHITNRSQVKKLKGYDLIVRINRDYPVSDAVAQKTTPRTDVWYACLPMIRQSKVHKGVLIKTEAPEWERALGFEYSDMTTDPKIFDRMTGCRTNRGFMAIMDILCEQPAELYITGITFYRGGAYHPQYLDDQSYNEYTASVKGKIGNHDPEAQLRYFAENVAILPNVTMDKELHHVLSEFKAQTTR